jgi:hypothetical protein
MKNPYPNEQFTDAVDSMATSPKSLQDRVADAYVHSLSQVKTEDVPEEIQAQFEELKRKLTRVEAVGDEGAIAASIRQLSTDEAITIAKGILHMAYVVRSDYYDI